MDDLSDKEIAQYFQRSYTAVDGLWFLKIEERHGLDEALVSDCEVWKVLPKIQARTLKTLTRMEHGMDALFHCLTTKLKLEGYRYTTTKEDDRSFKIIISNCPWYNALIRAGRATIAGTIGARICRNEYSVWANEFGDAVEFEMKGILCGGSEYCRLEFRKREM